MSQEALDKLLTLAGPALGGGEPAPAVAELGRHGPSLSTLLVRSNGFYAFESALHVLPSASTDRMSLELWNDRDLWRSAYDNLTDGLVFFAEDILGSQFVLSDAGVGVFDPETGEVEILARDLAGWAAVLLGDYEYLTGQPLAHAWQLRHGPIREGERLLPKMPFVTGGEYEVENLYSANAVEGMKVRGDLAVQIRDLPDGTKIRYRLVD